MPDRPRIIVLEGDQTGQELLEQALGCWTRPCAASRGARALRPVAGEPPPHRSNEVVLAAARAMREAGYGIKAATITPEGADDVGSPNKILREAVDGQVIIRAGRRIPG